MEHRWTRGDTPEKLSVRYGIPACMLMQANRGKKMIPGTVFAIPEITDCMEAPCAKKQRQYVLRQNDTLFSIAREFHTTMYEILQCNGIEHPARLLPGMRILLPEPVKIYTCSATDTIPGVCEKLHLTETELRRCNRLENGLYLGLQLRIP